MNINGITLTFFPKEIEYVRENFISVIGKEYSVHQINTQSKVLYEYYVYAQFLKNSFIAIFDGKYSKPVCSTKELNTQNVLFIICVSISDMIKLIFFPIQL